MKKTPKQNKTQLLLGNEELSLIIFVQESILVGELWPNDLIHLKGVVYASLSSYREHLISAKLFFNFYFKKTKKTNTCSIQSKYLTCAVILLHQLLFY